MHSNQDISRWNLSHHTFRGCIGIIPSLPEDHVISQLIPFCSGKRGMKVNLNELFKEACELDPQFAVVDPIQRGQALAEFHRAQGIDFSYGGYLEDRSATFADTYMAKDNRFIHLGIDINVPTGMAVHFPRAAKVLNVSRDFDTDVGWGTRIDLVIPELPLVVLLGHLAPDVDVIAGEILSSSGKKIGTIGDPSVNGGCDPHLHVQVMDKLLYDQLVGGDRDGYGKVTDLPRLMELYPDPLHVIGLLH